MNEKEAEAGPFKKYKVFTARLDKDPNLTLPYMMKSCYLK